MRGSLLSEFQFCNEGLIGEIMEPASNLRRGSSLMFQKCIQIQFDSVKRTEPCRSVRQWLSPARILKQRACGPIICLRQLENIENISCATGVGTFCNFLIAQKRFSSIYSFVALNTCSKTLLRATSISTAVPKYIPANQLCSPRRHQRYFLCRQMAGAQPRFR